MTPQQEEEAEMEYCNGFEDDVNPLRILRNTATELQDYSNLLSGSDSLDQFHQEGIYAQYRNAVGNADNLLQAMSKHVSDTNDVINDIISMLNESSACIRSRLEETYVPFDAGRRICRTTVTGVNFGKKLRENNNSRDLAKLTLG